MSQLHHWYYVTAASPSCAMTGTTQPQITEPDVVTGGKTIIYTLSNATWVAEGASFNAQRANIIASITSFDGEAGGWNARVRSTIPVGNVVRDSDTQITVTLPATADYQITARETILVTVDGRALSTEDIEDSFGASPTFTVAATKRVFISGTATPTIVEADVVTGGKTWILTAQADTWVAEGATFDAQRRGILDGMTSAQSEGTGWNTEVRDNAAVGSVVRDSDTQVTVTLGASPAYDITAEETITHTIPAAAFVASNDAIVATPTVGISLTTEPAASGVEGYGRVMRSSRRRALV